MALHSKFIRYGDWIIIERHFNILHGNSVWLLAYAGDVNTLGGSIRTLKENAEALVAAAREIGLEESADKTKYMVISRDQNAGRTHSVRMDNSTFERVEEFKYIWNNFNKSKCYSGRN